MKPLLAAALCALPLLAAPDSDAPRELGAVKWQRKLGPALVEAAKTEKPVLLLFQEIPG